MDYSVRAAAIATGVSESRLRTWERRYGVPHPRRSPTGRRLYDERDLATIQRMQSLVDAGVPAAQAANAVLSEDPAALVQRRQPDVQPPHPLVGRLTEASNHLDTDAAGSAIRQAVHTLGWPAALRDVVFPALRQLGDEWATGGIAPVQEHLLSEQVRLALLVDVAHEPPAGLDRPLVILACPAHERHDLGLAALWLLLRQGGLRVCYLGGDVPANDLVLAVLTLGADAVCLAATAPSSRPELGRAARELALQRVPAVVFAGGPALGAERAPEAIMGIRLPDAIDAAAQAIAARLLSE